jgi:nicotinamidase-related amidase
MSGSSEQDYFLKFRTEAALDDKRNVNECFEHFDKNRDNALDSVEFEQLLKALFSFNGNPYFIQKPKVQAMFNKFDTNRDDKITREEFEYLWFKLIRPTLLPCNALVIVDVQNDFIDGTLSLKNCASRHDGSEVVPIINHLIDTVPFDVIVYTLDWHPADHCSFIENVNLRQLSSHSPKRDNIKVFDSVIFQDYPDIEQKLWPAHCVQNSPGAELHPKLRVVDERTDSMKRRVVYTKKGCKSDIDSYSAFFDNCKLNETSLNSDLRKLGVSNIYVCGLAADVCVAATSADGLSLGYRVAYIEDASRGVDLNDIVEEKKKLESQGAVMIDSKQIYNMVTGKDRRPELGYSIFKALF